MYRLIISSLLFLLSAFTGYCRTDTLRLDRAGVIRLNRDVDLKNKEYVLPRGVTIIGRGGVFKNGTLVGNDTKIESERPVFDKVTVRGRWNVPYISTALFRDLSYDNALRDVVALSDDGVQNEIVIGEGDYVFSFRKNGETGIAPASNTQMRIDGNLTLKPNDFTNYYIINMEGENIHISGNGVIEGDKHTHTGNAGEWGMGVNFKGAVDCSVSGLTIRECWGDCIYIGTNSGNIVVKDCRLQDGRRQGISITSADGVVLSDCTISDVSGTDPQYAVDIEPNANGTVRNVTVENVRAEGCVGGFMIWGGATGACVEDVVFSNCSSSGTSVKYPVLVMKASRISLTGISVLSSGEYAALAQDIDTFVAENNEWNVSGRKPLNIISCTNRTVRNNENRK